MNDILDDSYESDLTEAESTELLLMCGHAIAPPLSPGAQAVLDAFRTSHTGQGCLAAALRAAADQVTPAPLGSKPGTSSVLKAIRWERKTTREQLLAIAAELEQQS